MRCKHPHPILFRRTSRRVVVAIGSLLVMRAAPLAAQETGARLAVLPRLSVAGHLGATYPVGALRDVATSGVRAAASITVRVAPAVGLYAGYASTGFLARVDESDLADGGPLGGVAIGLPLVVRGTRPVARVGAIHNRLRSDASERAAVGARRRALGAEAQLGWPLPLGRRFAPTPALRGQSYRPAGRSRVSHWGAEIGVELRPFGR
jgi:hypothetical protein